MNTELYKNVFWVGDVEQINALQCNPYLILDGDEAVLFDPGSSLDFEKVFSNVIEITPIETVKYVVLSHQDPDLLQLRNPPALPCPLPITRAGQECSWYAYLQHEHTKSDQTIPFAPLSAGQAANFCPHIIAAGGSEGN